MMPAQSSTRLLRHKALIDDDILELDDGASPLEPLPSPAIDFDAELDIPDAVQPIDPAVEADMPVLFVPIEAVDAVPELPPVATMPVTAAPIASVPEPIASPSALQSRGDLQTGGASVKPSFPSMGDLLKQQSFLGARPSQPPAPAVPQPPSRDALTSGQRVFDPVNNPSPVLPSWLKAAIGSQRPQVEAHELGIVPVLEPPAAMEEQPPVEPVVQFTDAPINAIQPVSPPQPDFEAAAGAETETVAPAVSQHPVSEPGSTVAAIAEAPVTAKAPVSAGATVLPAAPMVPAIQMQPAPVKTLEDTVSELMRPLLRQWLDENMPRIVEKAFREELIQRSDLAKDVKG